MHFDMWKYYVDTISILLEPQFADPVKIMVPMWNHHQAFFKKRLQVIRRNSRTQVASRAQLRCLKKNMLRFKAGGSFASLEAI